MDQDDGSGGKSQGAQTVQRALTLLDVLACNRGRLRLSDLSVATGLNITTTSRLLSALARFGFVEREEQTGRYALGYRFLELAQIVLEQTPLPEIANPILAGLMEETGETATLCVRHDDEAIVIARAECTNPLRTVAQIGHTGPLHCTAHGKVMLAYLSDTELARILNRGMPALTDLTITSPARMIEELAAIRTRGYAIDPGERELGLVSIAAPVRDAADRVVATCGVSGSGQRMRLVPALADQVTTAAARISGRLGHRSARG
jgi:IclR family transcriptional regulator, KDG regulon repressor